MLLQLLEGDQFVEFCLQVFQGVSMYVCRPRKKKINFDVDKNRFKELSNDYVHTCFNFQTVVFGEKVSGNC